MAAENEPTAPLFNIPPPMIPEYGRASGGENIDLRRKREFLFHCFAPVGFMAPGVVFVAP